MIFEVVKIEINGRTQLQYSANSKMCANPSESVKNIACMAVLQCLMHHSTFQEIKFVQMLHIGLKILFI